MCRLVLGVPVITAVNAAIGYGATALLTATNPVAGAIVGASYGFTASVTGIVADDAKLGISARIIASIASIFAGTFLGQALCAKMGMAITFKAALILTGVTMAGNLAIVAALVCACCLCCLPIILAMGAGKQDASSSAY